MHRTATRTMTARTAKDLQRRTVKIQLRRIDERLPRLEVALQRG
jgi:hypothetical protein